MSSTPEYFREVRQIRRELNICLKCGKADQEFPYSCCTRCRSKQGANDQNRAKARREGIGGTPTLTIPSMEAP